MTALVWDQVEDRRYEAGVNRGVFYPLDDPGMVWNGLISVDEGFVGAEQNFYHVDGIRYLDTIGSTDFQAEVTAFSAPPEFAACAGEMSIIPGFRLAKQPKSRFHFSYQTPFGDGYKIHLVYNVLATPTSKVHTTLSNTPDPTLFTWTFDATPVAAEGFKPSAHYVVDSNVTDPEILSALEGILYGTELVDPTFPAIEDLVALFPEEE